MSVPSGVARVRYIGSGSPGPFAFNFVLYSSGDLNVVKTVDGVDEVLVETTDYVVSVASDFSSATILLVDDLEGDGVDDGDSEILTLTRDPPIQQLSRWPRNDPFPAATHERAADLAVMMIGRLAEKLGRAPLLKESSTFSNLTVPDPEANKVLGWNTGGTDLENKVVADLGAVVVPGSSTDMAVARWDGATGDALQNSVVIIDDSGNVTGVGNSAQTGFHDIAEIAAPANPAASTLRAYANADILRWKTAAGVVHTPITKDTNNDILGTVRNSAQTGFHDIAEMAAPSNPAANVARAYAVDASGTTTLTMRDSAGVVVPLSHFTQAGTGAVLRTMQAKLQDALSVKDFGAVGDGVTDDTAAIQAAIDAADGGSVHFPWTSDGYRLTDTIEFGASLTPSGRAKHLIGEAYVRLFFDGLSNTTDAVIMHWDTLASIQGLTIDLGNTDASDATYTDGRDGLVIRGGEWGHLDVNVINCGRDGVHFEAAAAFEWTENFNGKLRVFNCGRDALHLRLPDLNAVFLNECRFQLFEARRWKRHAVHAVVNTQVATYSAAKMSSMCFENINLDANRAIVDMTATDLVYFETDAGAPGGGLFEGWSFLQGGWENITAAMTGRGINMDTGVDVTDLQMGPIIFFNLDPGGSEIDRMVDRSKLTRPFWLRCGTSGGDQDRFGAHQITQGATAVNGFELSSAATGVAPALVARGDDTNVGVNITTKGGGTCNFSVNNFATSFMFGLTSPAGGVAFPSIGTTASAANAFLDSGNSNRLLRSTSSERYKRDIEALEDDYADALMKMKPVWYRSKAEHDNPEWSWYGLLAEDVAAIDPRLVHWGYHEDDYDLIPTGTPEGKGPQFEKHLKEGAEKSPDGVMYERLSVLLLSVIQRQEKRLRDLEAR